MTQLVYDLMPGIPRIQKTAHTSPALSGFFKLFDHPPNNHSILHKINTQRLTPSHKAESRYRQMHQFVKNSNDIGFVSCQLSVVSCQLSVVSCQLSVVSCQLSVVSCQLSVVSCQLSVVSCQLSVVSCQLSVVSCQLSVVSCQLSVVSCQLSVVSCQLSVVSCQLSVVSGQWAVGCRECPADQSWRIDETWPAKP